AHTLLEHLERDLPLLSREVVKARADCALAVGPFDEAARFYTLRGDPDSLVKASLALERAGRLAEARTSLDHALRLLGSDDDPPSVAMRIRARSARSRVANLLHDSAAVETDLRWLALEAPATEAGGRAVAGLSALSPPSHLTADQQLIRGKRFAEAGRI